MTSEQPSQPWYAQTWAAVVALLFFFPLGLFLMWRYQRWEVWIKTVITVAGSLFTILVIVSAAVGGDDDDGGEAVRQETSPSPTVAASPSPTVEAPTPTLEPEPTPSRPEPTPTPEPEPTPTPTPEPAYPMVDINDYPVGTAERAFAEWITAWKNGDFTRMANFSQKTWLDGEDDPAEVLYAWYEFKELLGAEITNVDRISDVMNDVTATIYYAFWSEVEEKQITARVIREIGPYDPSRAGDWGVNPISTLRQEEVP